MSNQANFRFDLQRLTRDVNSAINLMKTCFRGRVALQATGWNKTGRTTPFLNGRLEFETTVFAKIHPQSLEVYGAAIRH